MNRHEEIKKLEERKKEMDNEIYNLREVRSGYKKQMEHGKCYAEYIEINRQISILRNRKKKIIDKIEMHRNSLIYDK